MKIGVNLLGLSQDRFGGVEQYLKNLIWFLATKEDKLELFLFLTAPNSGMFPDQVNRIKKVILKNSDEPSEIYEAIHRCQLDLWFCPLHRSYLSNIPIPSVVTIHDVLHTFYPEFVPGGLEFNNQYYRTFAPSFDAIITISEFSKKSITDQLCIPEEKIHAIYLDASKEFCNPPNRRLRAKIKAKYKLPEVYALYPASYNPHKNHYNLLTALIHLRDRHKKSIPLVLTGYTYKENMVYQSVVKFLRDHDLGKQVKILGYVPQQAMPYLYYNANFLVFPSLFEGFGIPLVEAMRTQTPIVCSNGGSIPEVVGDAALLFNPHSPEDIALKMLQVLDPETRTELIEKGQTRVKAFSWEKSAQETLNVFRSIMST
ncbi:glycosyltransferase family 1 protein [Bacillus cereus]|uniref:glycosyltransferase family 4 protein n=1 Tax=Bacillus cereus TaxID=1396 RepID=UPI00356F30AA